MQIQPWWREFLRGCLDELPLLVGVAPFGMIYGVLALEAGLNAAEAQSMSWIVFAGSAQLITVELARTGTPEFLMVITAAVVNLRHALYSASVAPYSRRLPARWKAVLAYLLTDEAYAVTITRFRRGGDLTWGRWYFLGAGLTLWACWQASTAAGILLGPIVPASLALDFTLALTFIALLVPTLKDRPSIAAALSAGLAALAGSALPYQTGLLAAALVGIGVGMALEGWK
jgi:4-azaleucine resistance transporter AzlC